MSEWDRPHFGTGGGDAFVYFAVFGEAPEWWDIPGKTYRARGLPDGLEIRSFDRRDNGEYIRNLTEGYAWDRLLVDDPETAKLVAQSPGCLVVSGEIPDPPTLEYFRDVIGTTTYISDHGGVAVLDLQTWAWFTVASWRTNIFEPDAPQPRRHVTILISEEEGTDRYWFHTRGMRKFGRPDVSVHDVSRDDRDGVADLCNRIIEYQAKGGILEEDRPIISSNLPWRAAVRHCGSVDDLHFNNVHIEVTRL